MNSDFKDVLYLFSCGALGKVPEINHTLNIEEIYKISCKQGISGVVFLPIEQLYKNGEIYITDAFFQKWEQTFFAMAAKQLKRRIIINEVLCELKKNDINAYLLKGDIVAQYYTEPLSRISSDTDIYVGSQQLDNAEKIFEKCGFIVKARSPMEHHTVCNHPVCGNVDLLLSFYDKCFEEKFFKGYTNITEGNLDYQIDEYSFTTLGATDNAIFLFLHWVKHFLSCGTGIRQLMDFFLFWKNNCNDINLSKFKQMLNDLGFAKLYASSVNIGLTYLKFNESEIETFGFEADDLFTNWLLTDIEHGGVFGKLEQRRLTFYSLFANDKMLKFTTKNLSNYIKMYVNTFKYNYLSKKYIYLNKSKFLLPIAYINRTYDLLLSVFRLTKIIRKTNTTNDDYANILERINTIDTVCKK